MDEFLAIRLAVLTVLMVLSAAFSASEVALFSLSPSQIEVLKKKPGSAGRIVGKLLASPSRLLVTIYIGNELINVGIAAVSTILAMHAFGDRGVAVAVGVGTFLLLIFGEITPKSFAFRNAEKYALFVAWPLYGFWKIVFPFQFVIAKIAEYLIHLTGETPSSPKKITEEEMKTVLTQGELKGTIAAAEKEIILNIFELGDTPVTDIMTPRTEIFSLPLEEGFDTVARRASLSNYSRIPVYRKESDHIIGILYTKDILDPKFTENGKDLEKMLHEAYFIPETKKIDELLREFRRKQIHIAIVMNEYGGVEGLVTFEDIFEEVLGSAPDPLIEGTLKEVEPGVHLCPGRMLLEDFDRRFGTQLENDEIDTVAGLVFHLFGRMPVVGESVENGGVKFTVRKTRGAKIWQVTIELSSSVAEKENRQDDVGKNDEEESKSDGGSK